MDPLEFFRSTCPGQSLIEVLNGMIASGELPPEEAMMILTEYDNAFEKNLRSHLIVRKDLMLNDAEGELSNYNNVDNLWRVDMKDLKLKIGDKITSYPHARLLFARDEEQKAKSSKKK